MKPRLFIFVILILGFSMLSSCASNSKVDVKVEEEDEGQIEEQLSSIEAEPRERIYIYNNPEAKTLKEVTLGMQSEPLLLASGYARLVGVVSGGRPIALIEVGGKGFGVEVGDEVCGYRVVSIGAEAARLLRKEGI